MRLKKVTDSTAVAELNYSADKRILRIRFTSGGTLYSYHNVSPDKIAGLHAADSKGKYVNAHIKPHHKVTTAK